VCSQLGGSGGGDEKFGQGGGRLENDDNNNVIKEKIKEALISAEELIIKSIGG
jgi:hypothetical protein